MTHTENVVKRCQKCGKDVSHSRRLKDAHGHYWCPDCGAPGTQQHDSGLVVPCPKCGNPVHAAHMVRKDGSYVCEHCAAGVKGKGGKVVNEAQAAQRKKLILAVALLVGCGVVYYVMNVMMA